MAYFVAHYAANNEYAEFDTFEEAKIWLREAWLEDGSDDEGYADETLDGKDYIAKITHVSKFIEKGNKEKDGYKWNDEKCGSVNKSGDMWPVSENFDFYGEVVLEKLERSPNDI